MEATATLMFLRSTARKARLVADAVRGRSVAEALNTLEYGISRKVGEDISKLVKSAVANLQNKNAETPVDVDSLRIKEIKVDGGPTMKRFKPRAQGRYGRIRKRMCHISVTVTK